LLLTGLCSVEDAEVIYRDATALNLVDAGYAWIVTEQALLPHNTPIGYSIYYSPCYILALQ